MCYKPNVFRWSLSVRDWSRLGKEPVTIRPLVNGPVASVNRP
jgi:hypothetical protein